jgi:hypothetical protein
MPERMGLLSSRQRKALLWGEALRLGATLLLVGFVYFTSVAGRSDVVRSQRGDCERTSHRIHLLTADASLRRQPALARALDATLPRSCAKAFPDPGPLPFGRVGR